MAKRRKSPEEGIEEIQKELEKLNPGQLYKVLRGSIKRAMVYTADRVTARAIDKGLNVDRRKFAKSLRAYAFGSGQGGFVSSKVGSGARRNAGQYPTAHGERKGIKRLKPIAMWAADGTEKRATGRGWLKRGHNTGAMDNYRLFENESSLLAGADRELEKTLIRAVKRAVKKCNN